MSQDIGLDRYGAASADTSAWGYLPHEDKYNKPTIDGRNAAVIMKGGVYDGKTDTHTLMDQEAGRARTPLTPGTTRAAVVHPFDRMTRPSDAITTPDFDRQILLVDRGAATTSTAASKPAAVRPPAGGRGPHGEAWQHNDPLILDMYQKLGGASVHAAPVRPDARDRQAVPRRPNLPARVPPQRSLVHQAERA